MDITGGLSELPLHDAYVVPQEKITPLDDLWNHIHSLKEELSSMDALNTRINIELARCQDILRQHPELIGKSDVHPPPWSTKPHLMAPLIYAYDNRVLELESFVDARDQHVKQLTDELRALTVDLTSMKQELKNRAVKIKNFIQERQENKCFCSSSDSNLKKVIEERANLLVTQNAMLLEERQALLTSYTNTKKRLDRILEEREAETTPPVHFHDTLNKLRNDNLALQSTLSRLISESADQCVSFEKQSEERQKNEVELKNRISELEAALSLAALDLEAAGINQNSSNVNSKTSHSPSKSDHNNSRLEITILKDSIHELSTQLSHVQQHLTVSEKARFDAEMKVDDLTRLNSSLESQLSQVRLRAEKGAEESLEGVKIMENLRLEKEKMRRQVEEAEKRHAIEIEKIHALLAAERRSMEQKMQTLEDAHIKNTESLRQKIANLEENEERLITSRNNLERDSKAMSADKDALNARIELYRAEAERAKRGMIGQQSPTLSINR
eukprot:GDKJ01059328.1.p1 GENE.GDKJ01059328.1~~GDKJ01059328.1.p1  ORF type:complete len:509 (-),score=94.22 GDKJ01059328.1:226-1728(-)